MFSYACKWNANPKTTFIASMSPTNPQESLLIGMVARPSKKLALFTELKATPDMRTEFLAGYRANFSEG